MNFLKQMFSFVHRMNVFDVMVLKLTTFFGALWLYRMFPKFFGQFNTWFFFGVMMIGAIYLIYRISHPGNKLEQEQDASLSQLEDAIDEDAE